MKHQKREFRNETIVVDFNEFVDCRFFDCTLVYHGAGPVGLSGCSFANTEWTFSDSAARTLDFLSALYHGMGKGGAALVEDTFESIRKGRN